MNQTLPSGPVAIWLGLLFAGSGNSVIAPAGVMRPILFAFASVNQRLPSGPSAIPVGLLSGVGIENSVIGEPESEIRPILSSFSSVNHMFPSGPGAMPAGRLLGDGVGNCLIEPAGAARALAGAASSATQMRRVRHGGAPGAGAARGGGDRWWCLLSVPSRSPSRGYSVRSRAS